MPCWYATQYPPSWHATVFNGPNFAERPQAKELQEE